MSKLKKSNAAGFTIIELLIATLIFSLVLMLITVSVLSFTKSYYQGVNQSNTQTAARAIIDDISQAIQFSGGGINPGLADPGDGSNGFCIGNRRYSFLLGWQLIEVDPTADLNQSKHALVVDTTGVCTGSKAQAIHNDGPVAGTELLPPRMRLAKLNVESTGSPAVWRVTVRVVYGDNDLLCSPSNGADCKTGDTTSPLNKPDLSCKVAFAGSQYCAAAELSTVVKKRVSSGQ